MRPPVLLLAIAAGYVLAALGGLAAVAINGWMTPAEASRQSGGMVAFGDLVLFVGVAGLASLAPTWFLLALMSRTAPRLTLGLFLLAAALGPVCWGLLALPAPGASSSGAWSRSDEAFSWFVGYVALPRIAAGPILVALEAAALLVFKTPSARAALVLAMLMDVVPWLILAAHLVEPSRT
ncbi:MAG: hypothetical protein U1E62_07920 [Alsobacter sp.]